jgi:nucleoid-associated protein YgaU
VGAIVKSIRFVVGLSMVASGVVMALPVGTRVFHGWSAASIAGHSPASVAAPTAAPVEAPPAAPPVAGQQWMVAEEALPPPVELRADYAPPAPPERLPAAPATFVADGGWAMNGTYRSTLEVPPPPLLDSQSAPPVAPAWATADSHRPAAPPATPPADDVPSTYVVRDGDDLTGIAARFYGHPAAAASVWAANRDVIPDPNLLPIGVHLRLPPPWTIQGLPASPAPRGRSIEPSVGPAAPPVLGRAASAAGGPQALPAGWIEGGQPPQAASRSVPRGGVVRLGPGETLETLAVKLYGDRGAATRIWEANRDRLRSPELAVAGMELRLP